MTPDKDFIDKQIIVMKKHEEIKGKGRRYAYNNEVRLEAIIVDAYVAGYYEGKKDATIESEVE